MKYRLILLFVINIFFNSNSFSQNENSKLFIEPYVYLEYDSTKFQIVNRFSNSVYKTETYQFNYSSKLTNSGSLFITVDHSTVKPNTKFLDSLIKHISNELSKNKSDTLNVIRVGDVFHNNGFSCVGLIANSKIESSAHVWFKTIKMFEDGLCDIRFSSKNDNQILNFSQDSLALIEFLEGIKTFSNADFEKEKEFIEKNFSVTVVPTTSTGDFYQFERAEFYGNVIVDGPDNFKIKEVHVPFDGSTLASGYRIFEPQEDGAIVIRDNAKEKGLIEKECELIVLNSVGKK